MPEPDNRSTDNPAASLARGVERRQQAQQAAADEGERIRREREERTFIDGNETQDGNG